MAAIDKERWQALSPLLDELLDADETTRQARLAQIHRENATLGADLAALLAQQARVETAQFLEGSVFPLPELDALAGTAVGNYTLERLIGQGGMGSVWLARRSDGRYEGRAAVKFLSLHLTGRSGLERFQREGSVLARLAHRNIARLLDAGVHAGQPYLVLEYIDGAPIDMYCDAHTLPVEARVRVFLDVLGAVSHAHSNLILHRDLKPSNILVDAQGEAKLLDFGIAKLIDERDRSAGATQLTQAGGRAFTPEYAAPEQIQGNDATTATDVYALGVLLHVLLAGTHPTADPAATPIERLRAVVEREPARPSDSARSVDAQIAARRGATPVHLARALQGDLDNIILKALKKDPAQRYATVDAFATDLRRYLANEPVSARPDSLRYRAGKFVRRHRLAVGASVATLLVLVAGVAGTTWQAHEAQQQRDEALLQLRRADATNRLISLLFSEVPQDKPYTPAELLARGEAWAAKLFENDPRLHAEMLLVLGDRYGDASDEKRALALYEQAYQRSLALDAPLLRGYSACRVGMQLAFAPADQHARARALIEEGLAVLRNGNVPLQEAECLTAAAYLESHTGAQAKAIEFAEQALRLVDAHPGRRDDSMQGVVAVLASMYTRFGRYGEAARLHERSVQLMERAGLDGTVRMATVLNNAAHNLFSAGATLDAVRLFERAIAIDRASGAPGGRQSNLANALLQVGRAREAAELHLAAAESSRRAGSALEEGRSLLGASNALREAGDLVGARQRLEQTRKVLDGVLPPGHIGVAAIDASEGRLLLAEGHAERALAVLQGAEARYRSVAPRSSDRALALGEIAMAQLELGKPQEALANAEAAVELTRAVTAGFPFSFRVGQAEFVRCRVLIALKRPSSDACGEAERHLRRAIGEDAPLTRAAIALRGSAPKSD